MSDTQGWRARRVLVTGGDGFWPRPAGALAGPRSTVGARSARSAASGGGGRGHRRGRARCRHGESGMRSQAPGASRFHRHAGKGSNRALEPSVAWVARRNVLAPRAPGGGTWWCRAGTAYCTPRTTRMAHRSQPLRGTRFAYATKRRQEVLARPRAAPELARRCWPRQHRVSRSTPAQRAVRKRRDLIEIRGSASTFVIMRKRIGPAPSRTLGPPRPVIQPRATVRSQSRDRCASGQASDRLAGRRSQAALRCARAGVSARARQIDFLRYGGLLNSASSSA